MMWMCKLCHQFFEPGQNFSLWWVAKIQNVSTWSWRGATDIIQYWVNKGGASKLCGRGWYSRFCYWWRNHSWRFNLASRMQLHVSCRDDNLFLVGSCLNSYARGWVRLPPIQAGCHELLENAPAWLVWGRIPAVMSQAPSPRHDSFDEAPGSSSPVLDFRGGGLSWGPDLPGRIFKESPQCLNNLQIFRGRTSLPMGSSVPKILAYAQALPSGSKPLHKQSFAKSSRSYVDLWPNWDLYTSQLWVCEDPSTAIFHHE